MRIASISAAPTTLGFVFVQVSASASRIISSLCLRRSSCLIPAFFRFSGIPNNLSNSWILRTKTSYCQWHIAVRKTDQLGHSLIFSRAYRFFRSIQMLHCIRLREAVRWHCFFRGKDGTFLQWCVQYCD